MTMDELEPLDGFVGRMVNYGEMETKVGLRFDVSLHDKMRVTVLVNYEK